jgi:peptidoglycan hydrolase-like protein with peptidoglycan-binding domain
VQKFLGLYGSSVKVDNDYGATTVTAVKAFQKAQKITADGEAGAGTFSKMISWLKTKK